MNSNKKIKVLTLNKNEPLIAFCIESHNIFMNNLWYMNADDILKYQYGKKWIAQPSEELYTNYYYKYTPEKIVVNDKTNIFISAAKDLLQKNDFNINNSNPEFTIEMHNTCSSFKTNIGHPIVNELHKDDYQQDYWTEAKFPTYTIAIYYDVKCDDGKLSFYEINENDDKENLFLSVDVQNPSNDMCKVVMFDGEILHQAESYFNGYRNCIIVNISKE